MSDMLNLYCWVFGDDSRRVFPIKIAKSETVGDLKEATKDEMKSDAAAHSLSLEGEQDIDIDDLMEGFNSCRQ